MRSFAIVTAASALAVSSLVAAPAAHAAAGAVEITVDEVEEAVVATASAAMPYTDFLVRTTQSGTVAQVTIEVDPDGEGTAQLWSNAPGCPTVPQATPVTSITCSISVPVAGSAFALVDFSATTEGSQVAVLQGSTLPVEFIGGSGSDYFQGASVMDTANGGPGDDFLFGGPGADVLDGGPGNDRVEGEEGRDIMIGGTGEDELLAADDEADALVQCGEEDSDVLVGTDTIETDPALDFVNGCYGLGSLTAPTDLKVSVSGYTGRAEWAGGAAATYQLVYRTEDESWQDGGRVTGNSGTIAFPEVPGIYEVGVAKVTDDAVSELDVVVDIEVGEGVPEPLDVSATALCPASGKCDYSVRWIVPPGAADAGIVSFRVWWRPCEEDSDTGTYDCRIWQDDTVAYTGQTAMGYSFTYWEEDRIEMRVSSKTAEGSYSRWVETYVDPELLKAPAKVDALASAPAMQVTWSDANSLTIPQYIDVQYLRSGGRTSNWTQIAKVDGAARTYRFTTAPKNATMRFRVSVMGLPALTSKPSPWRQATSSVPQPRNPKATYGGRKLTVSWTPPTKGVKLWDSGGAVNVRGYQVQVLSQGAWKTYPVQPVSGSRAVISMKSDPGASIRLRLVAWPETSESKWVTVSVKEK